MALSLPETLKNLLVTLSLLLTICYLPGQSIQSVKSAYDEASRQVVVLKNRNEFIPIKTLDLMHPMFVSEQGLPDLLESLDKYISFTVGSVQTIETRTWRSGVNLFILVLDLSILTPGQLIKASASINDLGIPFVVVYIHGKPGSLPSGLFDQADAILFSWGYSEYISTHIAQIIFGAEPSTGKLPFFLSNEFKSGAGFNTIGLQRLRYGPPEIVGIEGSSFKSALKLDMEVALVNNVFPGANLLIAKDGVVIYHEAFGKPTYDATTSLHKDQLYDLASVTKILGATLGSMVLNSRGLFDPNQTVKAYLPSFKRSNKSNLVWKDILTHRSGLPASISYYKKTLDPEGTYLHRALKPMHRGSFKLEVTDHLFANKNIPSKILKEIKKIPLLDKRDYVYSDLSMILLFKSIEQITRQPFDQFLEQQVYAPIGADHTEYLPLRDFTKDQIVPTEQDDYFRHELVQGYVHDENAALLGGISGHAGLFSNANDMAKLAQMLLNKGSYGGKQYLKPETVALYTAYQYPELNNRRGLGFDKPLLKYDFNASAVARDASPESYGHSGFTGTFIWIDPKYNLTYILLTNRVNPTRKNIKISEYSIRPCIQQTIYDHLLKKG